MSVRGSPRSPPQRDREGYRRSEISLNNAQHGGNSNEVAQNTGPNRVGRSSGCLGYGRNRLRANTPPGPNRGGDSYQSLFANKLAATLGVTRDTLSSAITQARGDIVVQGVKDGKLTQDQADKIKSQRSSIAFGFDFQGSGRGEPMGGAVMDGSQVNDAIAKALGITTQDLTNQLQSGKSLAEIASGKVQAVSGPSSAP